MVCAYIALLIIITVTALICAGLRRRRARVDGLLLTVASIVRQRLPLPAALRAAAHGQPDSIQKIYIRLADAIAAGHPLSTALVRARVRCSPEFLGALSGAECAGTVSAVLASVTEKLRRDRREPSGRTASGWYLVVMLIIVPLILLFVLVVIVPKFRVIFVDFATALPAITVLLVDVSYALRDVAPSLIGLLALFLVIVIVAALRRRRPGRFQISFAVLDTLAWRLPILRPLASFAALSQQLLILQSSVRAGCELSEAARHGAFAATNIHASRRMLRWADALRRGERPAESARQLGFPGLFVRILSESRDSNELAAGCEYLSEYYRLLHRHRQRLLVDMVTPLLVAAWALVVGFIVLALILPLVTLVQSVMNTIH